MSQLTGEAIDALHRMPGGLPSSPLLFDLQGGSPSATWLLVDKNIIRWKEALRGLGLAHHMLADQETRTQKLRAHIAAWYAALITQRAPAFSFVAHMHICGPGAARLDSPQQAADSIYVCAQGSAGIVSSCPRLCATLPAGSSATALAAPCSLD